jgi:hypothetical protein
MEYVKMMKNKIEQYEKDLKLIIEMSKKSDRIKTAKIKILFEDLIAENIISLAKMIKEFKEYINDLNKKEEKQNDV